MKQHHMIKIYGGDGVKVPLFPKHPQRLAVSFKLWPLHPND
jgi:hypothetical protein